MEAFWDHTVKDAKCYSIQLFITFALVNTGIPHFNQTTSNYAANGSWMVTSSFQYFYGRFICHLARSYHLETTDENKNTLVPNWSFEFGLHVSPYPEGFGGLDAQLILLFGFQELWHSVLPTASIKSPSPIT